MLGFRELVDRFGSDGAAILRAANLSENIDREQDKLVPFRSCCAALELAATQTGHSHFGLEWAMAMPDHFPNVGPVVMISDFVKNIEEWFFAAMQYWRHHTNSFGFSLLPDEDPQRVIIRYVDYGRGLPQRQIVEHTMCNLVRIAQRAAGYYDEKPDLMRFQHEPPANLEIYQQAFGCGAEFGARHNEVVFPRKLLAYPTNGNKRFLKPLLDLYVQSRIRHLPFYEQTMEATVRLAIPCILGTGRCSIEFVAASFGMSTKKLQRELAYEGTSFSEILDLVKQDLARSMLAETLMPIAHVAGLLDYSGNAAFTLAFRKWAGCSPSEWRKRNSLSLNARSDTATLRKPPTIAG